jgi:hypothetical protein
MSKPSAVPVSVVIKSSGVMAGVIGDMLSKDI